MSQELERVYTINLGKVLLSPDNQRAKRAINMVKEFARHHMKTEKIKIDEEVSHQIWQRGIRSPPRKIRVRMSKTDEGSILVSTYEEEVEEAKPAEEKKTPAEVKPKAEVKEIETTPEKEKEVKEEIKEEKPKAKEPKAKKPKAEETKAKEPKPKEAKAKKSKPQEPKPKETKQKETKKEPKAKESKTTKTKNSEKKSK